MKEETTEALTESAAAAMKQAREQILPLIDKAITRHHVKLALKLTTAITMFGSVVSLGLGLWIDDYMPLWFSVPTVLAFEGVVTWFGLAAGVSFFDHLQSEDESNKIFNK